MGDVYGIIFALLLLFAIGSSENVPGDNDLYRSVAGNVDVFQSLVDRISQLETAVKNHPVELAKVIDELRAENSVIRAQHAEEILDLRQELQRHVSAIEEQHKHEIANLNQRIGFLESPMATEIISPDNDEQQSDVKVAPNFKSTPLQYNFRSGRRSSDKRKSIVRQESARASSTRVREVQDGVAFFAKLSTHTQHLGYSQTIIFDNVTTNVGNNYDKNVGVFQASISGIYLFSTTITSFNDNSGHFGIFINGGRETMFYNNGGQNAWDETSQTIIVHLNKGDDVTIRSLDADHGVSGVDHSVFSGVLIYIDTDQSIIVG